MIFLPHIVRRFSWVSPSCVFDSNHGCEHGDLLLHQYFQTCRIEQIHYRYDRCYGDECARYIFGCKFGRTCGKKETSHHGYVDYDPTVSCHDHRSFGRHQGGDSGGVSIACVVIFIVGFAIGLGASWGHRLRNRTCSHSRKMQRSVCLHKLVHQYSYLRIHTDCDRKIGRGGSDDQKKAWCCDIAVYLCPHHGIGSCFWCTRL